VAKEVPAELQLDVLEAARSLSSAVVKAKLSRYDATRSASDPLSPFRETLEGGNAKAGERLFYHKEELSCLRCHKIKGEGGEVGPDLTGIGGKQKRDYLLEAIVEPSRTIAKGYETVVLTTSQGKIISGIVKMEDKQNVQLMTPEGQLVTVLKKDLEERQPGKSAMPEDLLQHLTLFELRDLVEFLASLK
jgi:quinoprotein glucose dehydrogenase